MPTPHPRVRIEHLEPAISRVALELDLDDTVNSAAFGSRSPSAEISGSTTDSTKVLKRPNSVGYWRTRLATTDATGTPSWHRAANEYWLSPFPGTISWTMRRNVPCFVTLWHFRPVCPRPIVREISGRRALAVEQTRRARRGTKGACSNGQSSRCPPPIRTRPTSRSIKLRHEGHEVQQCAGPIAGSPCPVLRGEPCWQVEWADVLLYDAWISGDGEQALIEDLRAIHPGKPMMLLSGGLSPSRHHASPSARQPTHSW